jgi:hypothetical protein
VREPPHPSTQKVTFRAAQLQEAPERLSKEGTDALIGGCEAMWTPELKAFLNGDTTLTDYGAYKINGGKLELDKTIKAATS